VRGLRERYAEISRHLRQARLPFAVDFQYQEEGVRVRGAWYPVLKMRWVEGLLLNEFVRDNLDRPARLHALAQIWARMAARLREADIAHGDLQHGNVILVPGSAAGSLAIKLIDYDGMWVRSLAGRPSGEAGHPNYQHPRRLKEAAYGPEMDRFSVLVVAMALRALAVGRRDLWDRYDNGDNLLFREADLLAPGQSPLFAELLEIGDRDTNALVVRLIEAARGPLESCPLLEELSPARPGAAANGNAGPQAAASEVAGTGAAAFDFAEEEGAPRRRRRRKSRSPVLAAAVGTLAAGLMIGLLVSAMAPESPQHPPPPPPPPAPRPRIKSHVMLRDFPRAIGPIGFLAGGKFLLVSVPEATDGEFSCWGVATGRQEGEAFKIHGPSDSWDELDFCVSPTGKEGHIASYGGPAENRSLRLSELSHVFLNV
jgi:hypothetical protein